MLDGPKRRKQKSRVFIHWLKLLYQKRAHLDEQAGSEKHNNDDHMGLILKCNEIKEKIRHLKKRGGRTSVYFHTHTHGYAFETVPSGLVPNSKIPVGLPDPHYPGYRPAIRFLPSRREKGIRGRKRAAGRVGELSCYLLRMRCDRFRCGFPTLVFRRYFSSASLCRLLFFFSEKKRRGG